MQPIRSYILACVDGGLAWDKSYTLAFTAEGRMFVRTIKQYEQPYKNSELEYIEPSDFVNVTVKGVALSELVAKKLEEILPAQPTLSHFPQ